MRYSSPLVSFVPALLVTCSLLADAPAQAPRFKQEHVDKLPWRHIGPVNMTGRVTDFETVPSQPGTWYVAAASGGLFKTTNAGITWTPLFQHAGSGSVGDVAVAPSDPGIVWVGTGEENARNSVSWGDGVYRSNDAGKTFTKVGLEASFQVGHIEIHPKDPKTVYVAALGQLWGENEERGLYRTRDDGKTWQKVLYLDDRTGCIDVRLEPSNPEIVYAVMYERKRDIYDSNDPAVRFGAHSGIYKSTDGGDTWARLSQGLPTCKWGRCSIEPWAGKAGTLFALLETERSGWERGDSVNGSRPRPYMGVAIEDAGENEEGAKLGQVVEGSPAAKAGFKKDDVVIAMGATGIKTGEQLGNAIDDRNTGDKVKMTVLREEKQLDLELTFGTAPAGGPGRYYPRLGGQTGNVQDRQGDLGYETGGVYRSDDFGATWTRLNSLIPRPFYFCSFTVDPNDDQTMYVCGIQLWRSTNGGRRFVQCNRGIHVDFHDVWVNPADSEHVVALCDGGVNISYDGTRSWENVNNLCLAQFYKIDLDNRLPYNVYGGLQDNGTWGGPTRTRYTDGLTKEDWFKIWEGDGFGAAVDQNDPDHIFATSQNGGMGWVNIATGAQGRVDKPGAVGGVRSVYNWDTPFVLSPHNSRIFYFAGTFACRSIDRGADSEVISKKLTLTDGGSATVISESPRRAGVLYAGTDDGAAWATRDGGKEWYRIDDKLPGVPGPRYVSAITPSHHSAGRVFLALDGHRSNDFGTYVFMSSNYGQTWRSITADLPPNQPVRSLMEDPKNDRLLFAGTEFGCYVSLDRGRSWQPLGSGLPTTPVHDLKIQDRDAELVAATHGRGIWILDIEPLRQLSRGVVRSRATLLAPHPAYLWRSIPRESSGHKNWAAPRAPVGASIYLFLKDKPEKPPEVVIKDLTGKQLARLTGKAVAGTQLIPWDARVQQEREGTGRGRAGGRGGGRAGGRGRRLGPRVPPGTYTVEFTHDGKTQREAVELRPDPMVADAAVKTHPLSQK